MPELAVLVGSHKVLQIQSGQWPFLACDWDLDIYPAFLCVELEHVAMVIIHKTFRFSCVQNHHYCPIAIFYLHLLVILKELNKIKVENLDI